MASLTPIPPAHCAPAFPRAGARRARVTCAVPRDSLRAGSPQRGAGAWLEVAGTRPSTDRLPTLRQALSVEPDASTTDAAVDSDAVPFDWKAHWYAVGCSADLDPSRPHPLMILGRRIVLWRDPTADRATHPGSGGTAWRCFLDQCPHRLVPLSEGRITEAGLLQCSYHGWTFAGNGSCQGIPQAAASGPEQSAVQSPRACAVSFPVAECSGILFVWPDEDPAAAAMAAATSPPLPVGVDSSFSLSSFSREVLYGYDMLAENVMDPSHLPFAHHGVGPLRRSAAKPYPVASVVSEREGARGFVGRLFEPTFPTFSPVHFQAPGLFTYHRSLVHMRGMGAKKDTAPLPQESVQELQFESVEAGAGGPVRITALYITPVAPGRSRLTTLEGSNLASKGLLGWVRGNRWLSHLFLQQVLDGDAYFLHAQEKVVETLQPPTAQAPPSPTGAPGQHTASSNGSLAASSSWLTSSAYFLPTSADRFVLAFRKWLQRHAGGKVAWPAQYSGQGLDAEWLPKERVLDRYAGHTASCTTCQKALANFRLAQKVLWGLGLAAAILAVRLTAPAWVRASLLVLGAGLGGAGAALQRLVQLFVYTGYDHATNH